MATSDHLATRSPADSGQNTATRRFDRSSVLTVPSRSFSSAST